jgi:lipopolysaccharide export system ATP-binding protein
MAGLVPVRSGRIRLNGIEITDWSVDRRARFGLAYLPEEPSVFRGLTVEENIAAVLERREMGTADRAAALEQLLVDFDLTQIRSQVASTISGGERRRCEVARAMALRPVVLLLDEPFRGLDPTSIDSVKRLMVRLRDCEVGVLASDYDLHDLLELTDRVYLLHGGRVAFSGTATQLLGDANAHRVFLGEGFSL